MPGQRGAQGQVPVLVPVPWQRREWNVPRAAIRPVWLQVHPTRKPAASRASPALSYESSCQIFGFSNDAAQRQRSWLTCPTRTQAVITTAKSRLIRVCSRLSCWQLIGLRGRTAKIAIARLPPARLVSQLVSRLGALRNRPSLSFGRSPARAA